MKDLTKGRPIKLIALFALPILLGNIFQQTYSLADIMIIGQNLGNNSIAAVGTTAPVVSLMFNIINGSITGFAIIVAKHFGAGDYDEMHRTIARMSVFAGGLTVLIIAAMTVFIDPLLHALDVTEGIFAEARSYLIIVTFGLVVTLLYNFEAGILRAVGDSVIPLVILVISTVLNIGFDLLLVCVFHMGVVGAALATVIAQAVSAGVCLVYLIKRRPFLLVGKKDFVFTARTTAELLSAGFGMALMYSIIDIGSIILQNGINGFKEDMITAHTAARKILMLLIMPFSSVSATLITYCSQNLGAGKFTRIRKGIKDCMLIMMAWATIAVVLVFLGGHALVGLIVNDMDTPTGAAIADTAVLYLRWSVVFFYPLALLLGLRCSLQGLGKSVVPIICSIIECLWKIVTVVVMIPLFGGKNGTVGSSIEQIGGYFGVVLSEPMIWTACGIVIGIITLVTLYHMPREDLKNNVKDGL
ncbi:MAG: MATE family efflux transporter [Ruminococcaceae bacterium]|nr:MATE family efflux transporter [Oscillospiraceae bacterium]